MSSSLGQLIRDGRTAKRMTLRELSRRLGVSPPFMHDVEHDRRPLSLDRCKSVSEVLDIPLAELEARAGLSRDLLQWLRSRPDVLAMLHEARRGGQSLVLIPSRPIDDDMNRRIGGITHDDLIRQGAEERRGKR